MKSILAAIIGIIVGYAGSEFLPMSQLPGMPGGHEMNAGAKPEDHTAHGGSEMAGAPAALPDDAPESSKAFAAANAKMHKDMTIALTGSADRDFVAGMIPHHQGAIDMANIVLQFGTDPEIKALATGIIAAQQAEIAQMNGILGRLGQ
jgi:uncharacterized protein (DUF305 family)